MSSQYIHSFSHKSLSRWGEPSGCAFLSVARSTPDVIWRRLTWFHECDVVDSGGCDENTRSAKQKPPRRVMVKYSESVLVIAEEWENSQF